jgi:hypothetical protein
VSSVPALSALLGGTVGPHRIALSPETSQRYRRAVDTYRIYNGTDENGIVGTVAPGLFAQEGRCWRMVYADPVGHGTHCMQPVAWVGRWKFLSGWTKVCRVSATRTNCRGPGGLRLTAEDCCAFNHLDDFQPVITTGKSCLIQPIRVTRLTIGDQFPNLPNIADDGDLPGLMVNASEHPELS